VSLYTIRFGEMTQDELFVTSDAAKEGVRIQISATDPLVLLSTFGPQSGSGTIVEKKPCAMHTFGTRPL